MLRMGCGRWRPAASRPWVWGKEAKAEHAAELQILDALPGDVHVRSLCVEVGFHAGEADDEEDGVAAQGQEDAVLGGLIGPFLVLFAEALGQQGVDAHAGADAHGDHDVLQRERQRNGGQGALADMGHENRVHHIVEGLQQVGQKQRKGEPNSVFSVTLPVNNLVLGSYNIFLSKQQRAAQYCAPSAPSP